MDSSSWSRRRCALACATVLPLVLLVASCTPPGGAGKLPVPYSTIAGLAQVSPEGAPPGANRWTCRPSTGRPRPVVLVHGTFMHQRNTWNALSPLLRNEGYCVFTFNYGGPPALGFAYGIGDVRTSAEQLRAFVDRVLAETGAEQVDLVGHSQGGLISLLYLQGLGGAAPVRKVVGLAPSTRGTTFFGLATLAAMLGLDDVAALACTSCAQQVAGSDVLDNLHAAGVVQPGVDYTVVATKLDEIVTPWQSSLLPSGPTVRNFALQDVCPLDLSGHIGVAFSPNALQLVLGALDPGHRRAPCRIVPTVN